MPRSPLPSLDNAWTVHIDGSAFPNPGRMTLGAVLVSPAGEQFSLSQDTRSTGCNNEAEALALLAALDLLAQHYAQRVCIYSDSSILVEQLTAASPKPVVRLSGLYQLAREAMAGLDAAQVRWIPRHRNTQADALARAALPTAHTGVSRVQATKLTA